MIGGTKGNVVLDFVSGAPNKEQISNRIPNCMDYDELTKYGYGHLITPIMKLGGRYVMYDLLELDQPQQPKQKDKDDESEQRMSLTRTGIVIDKTGKQDPNRYTGLKLGQVLDDSIQAEALEMALKKNKKKNKTMNTEGRPFVQEENYQLNVDDTTRTTTTDNNDVYEIPFSDKRNVGPKQTPDWTPERLDEWGKTQGRVQAWARKARDGEYITDPNEWLSELTVSQRTFSIGTALFLATVYGKATIPFYGIIIMIHDDDDIVSSIDTMIQIQEIMQGPALLLVMICLSSSLLAYQQAQERNRNPLIWFIKGLQGGPFTIATLKHLEKLQTRQERTR